MRKIVGTAAGLSVCSGLALAATALGRWAPLIGAPIIAIIAGLAVRSVVRPGPRLRPGIDVARSRVLQIAIVLFGAQLSLGEVVDIGLDSLPVMLGSLVACLVVAQFVGSRLGMDGDLRTLIGVGTGICGASAIAAVSPVIRARSTDVTYAVAVIFLFNIAAVFTFPALGHALGLSQQEFGLFAGTAVNDTSSVVAAASAYGSAATEHAVIVKLTRTLMIIPICLGLAALTRRRQVSPGSTGGLVTALRLIPWFLVGFLVTAGLNTSGALPVGLQGPLSDLAVFLVAIALAGIGMSTDVGRLRRTGSAPLLLGLILWFTVSATSLLLLWIT